MNTIKTQALAVAISFQRLASNSLVHTFVQGVIAIVPLVKAFLSPWYHGLVLSALQGPPFKSLHEVSSVNSSQILAILIAIITKSILELATLFCKYLPKGTVQHWLVPALDASSYKGHYGSVTP